MIVSVEDAWNPSGSLLLMLFAMAIASVMKVVEKACSMDSKEKCTYSSVCTFLLLLVSILTLLSPIICSGG